MTDEPFVPDVVVTRGRTVDNLKNLPKSMIKSTVGRYAGTRIGRQELDGEVLDEVAGALWDRNTLDEYRIRLPGGIVPAFKRLVIAIDPMVTDISIKAQQAGQTDVTPRKVGGSETGLIAAALGVDGHGYVLEDASISASPLLWATRAITLLEKWQGDRIIGEVNNGGALIEVTLRSINPNIPYRAVTASRGKMTRAEPVAALYEQGKVHHVGLFTQLEDQLVAFTGDPNQKSPDRLDALVWALTDLMLGSSHVPMVGPVSAEGTSHWSAADGGQR
jgi:phage terminase large subunit-like protein